LAAAMGMAFAIQTFFIPILRKNPKENQYSFFTLLAYILGGAAYMYIAFMGAFGKVILIKEY
jgi:predicted branched-subunit amino acid permease